MIRLLIIDDEDGFRQPIAKALVKLGFEVREAAEGKEGLRLALEHCPDLILCDVEMPERDGYQVMAALHREPILADIPLIFLTGQAAPSQVRQGMNQGADDYLTKPINLPDLTGAIAARLRRRQLQREPVAEQAHAKTRDSFLLDTPTEKRLVKAGEVKSILAYGEYSWVHWEGSEKGALRRKSLGQWVSELPAGQFIRVHRRAIVNLGFLERVEVLPSGRMQIHLRDTVEPIPVSLRQAPVLNRRLRALGH